MSADAAVTNCTASGERISENVPVVAPEDRPGSCATTCGRTQTTGCRPLAVRAPPSTPVAAAAPAATREQANVADATRTHVRPTRARKVPVPTRAVCTPGPARSRGESPYVESISGTPAPGRRHPAP